MSERGFRPVPSPDPRVGVVVLTHNRADEVSGTIERLAALPERPKVVVVDNASSDGTSVLLQRRFPKAQIVRLDMNVGAAGRNIGIRLCDRPYIALCDDDTWWQPGSLSRAADLMDRHPSLAVITGKVLVGEQERIDSTCVLMSQSPLGIPTGLPGPALLGFLAGASLARRIAFLQVGGFEPRFFLGAEEQMLAPDLASAGWALVYIEAVVIHHHPSPHRDARARRRLLIRNGLWTVWLRRPVGRAVAITADVLRQCTRDRAARAALIEAIQGLPWVIRNRRVIPTRIERQLLQIERQRREP
ncbi:MAG: glycosyltransferase [Chloroflexota bacterium]|nr:MAG: glycosyltransferase [Chloroflexota bacterium]